MEPKLSPAPTSGGAVSPGSCTFIVKNGAWLLQDNNCAQEPHTDPPDYFRSGGLSEKVLLSQPEYL